MFFVSIVFNNTIAMLDGAEERYTMSSAHAHETRCNVDASLKLLFCLCIVGALERIFSRKVALDSFHLPVTKEFTKKI